MSSRGGGGGWGTLKLFYYVGSGYFFGVKIYNLNNFGGFQKNIFFFFGGGGGGGGVGMKILWIFFWGHHKIGLY